MTAKYSYPAFALAASMRLLACTETSSPAASTTDAAHDAGAVVACVTFVPTDGDLACNAAAECTWRGDFHLCPNDPSCGWQIALNAAAGARYDTETSAVPLKPVSCGVPSPVACVAHRCALVGFAATDSGTD